MLHTIKRPQGAPPAVAAPDALTYTGPEVDRLAQIGERARQKQTATGQIPGILRYGNGRAIKPYRYAKQQIDAWLKGELAPSTPATKFTERTAVND